MRKKEEKAKEKERKEKEETKNIKEEINFFFFKEKYLILYIV